MTNQTVCWGVSLRLKHHLFWFGLALGWFGFGVIWLGWVWDDFDTGWTFLEKVKIPALLHYSVQ